MMLAIRQLILHAVVVSADVLWIFDDLEIELVVGFNLSLSLLLFDVISAFSVGKQHILLELPQLKSSRCICDKINGRQCMS